MQVKITDNALARDLFPMDYHCLGDNENRPVRWMALESLLNNDFSSASDVVSSRTDRSRSVCRIGLELCILYGLKLSKLAHKYMSEGV